MIIWRNFYIKKLNISVELNFLSCFTYSKSFVVFFVSNYVYFELKMKNINDKLQIYIEDA